MCAGCMELQLQATEKPCAHPTPWRPLPTTVLVRAELLHAVLCCQLHTGLLHSAPGSVCMQVAISFHM